MLLTITVLATCVGALLYFWHNVIHYFQTAVIPWVRQRIGSTQADVLAKILCYADNAATMTRRQVKAGWQWIRHNILGAESKYEKLDATHVNVISTVYVSHNNGESVQQQTIQKTTDWSELPASVRQ